MITLPFFFVFMIIIFSIIGSLRGWAKEILVTFSIILGIFIISILSGIKIFPPLPENFQLNSPDAFTQARTFFWVRSAILIILVFFGYQTPSLPKIGGQRFAREQFQDFLLGFFLGALNGFLFVGSLWFFMKEARFPYAPHIRDLAPNDPGYSSLAMTMQMVVKWLAPAWLQGFTLYIAVAIAFVFVIIVFL